MKYLKKQINKLLPKSIRKKLTQNQLDLSETASGLYFKQVESIEEFEAATKLLHDSYVQAGFMSPVDCGLRIIPHFFIPSTTMLIAMNKDKVIGTISLIRDSLLGLPMESIYDLSELRKYGNRLTEISSLAIHHDYRKKGGLILHDFIRYMWRFSLDLHGSETFVITVNPSMVQLYEDIYLFKQLNQNSFKREYSFVKGAPAVALYMNVKDSKSLFAKEYQHKKISKDLYSYIFKHNMAMFEQSDYYDINLSSINTDILQHFLNTKNDWWKQMDAFKKFNFIRSQKGVGRDNISYPDLFISPAERAKPRFDSNLTMSSANLSFCTVFDVSYNGIKLRNINNENLKHNMLVDIKVGIQKNVVLKVEPVWQNNHFTGFKVIDGDMTWEKYIDFLNANANRASTTAKHLRKSA